MSLPNSQPGPFARFAENIVFGNRPLILIVFAAVTLAMLYFASQLKVDAGFKKQVPLQHEYMQTFQDYELEFGGANRVLVAVIAKDGDMFDQDFMKTLESVTNEVINHIHFEFPDGTKIRKAFTYDWRIWTLPEIQEVLLEAGFKHVSVYWEGTDKKTGEGDGVWKISTRGEACQGWIAYLVAEK